MSAFEIVKERAKSMNDAENWNKLSKQKHTIEASVGKDAAFIAAHLENEVESARKKMKTDSQ